MSAAFSPASTRRRIPMICSSLNRLLHMPFLPLERLLSGGVSHIGWILFRGAGHPYPLPPRGPIILDYPLCPRGGAHYTASLRVLRNNKSVMLLWFAPN